MVGNERVRWALGLCVLLLGAVWLGCGQRSSVPLVQVQGQVTYKGQPVAEASVMLVPQESQKSAVGKTNAQGKFTIATPTAGDGAMPGKYKIVVTAVSAVEPAPDAAELPNVAAETAAAPRADQPGLPQKYASPQTTPLECEIPRSGSHDLGVIELSD